MSDKQPDATQLNHVPDDIALQLGYSLLRPAQMTESQMKAQVKIARDRCKRRTLAAQLKALVSDCLADVSPSRMAMIRDILSEFEKLNGETK